MNILASIVLLFIVMVLGSLALVIFSIDHDMRNYDQIKDKGYKSFKE